METVRTLALERQLTFGESPSLDPERGAVPVLDRKIEAAGEPGAGAGGGGMGDGAGAGRGGDLRGKRIR